MEQSQHTHTKIRYSQLLLPPPDDDAGQVEGLSHDSRREQLPGLLSDAGGNQHGDEVISRRRSVQQLSDFTEI